MPAKDLDPSKDWDLRNQPVPQVKVLEVADVKKVSLEALETYPPAGGQSGDLAIYEVTFATRKK